MNMKNCKAGYSDETLAVVETNFLIDKNIINNQKLTWKANYSRYHFSGRLPRIP